VPALQRPGFRKLLEKLEPGDTLVVTKLDRIGRDSIDVQKTVELCAEAGVRLVVLQLGNLDLTSSSGALMIKVLAAVADFERELIIERTRAGQERARAAGTHMGRPAKTDEAQRQVIRSRLASGETVTAVARDFKISRATVIAVRGDEPEKKPSGSSLATSHK
jgi:putative DNA-invertase from lambdoid prophage Rac